MRETLKRLARLTVGYSLVTLLGPLFTIFLTPLYTRVLSPADYGVVDVSLTLSGLITICVLLGIDQALSAYFFDGDEAYRRNLVTTAVVCVSALGLVAGAGLAIVGVPLAKLLFKDPGRNFIFYLLAINVVTVPIYGVISAALRLRMGVRRVNVLGLSLLLATVASNVILVLVFRLKATGIVAANVSANLAACGVGIALAWKPLRGRFSARLAQPLALAGIGLLPGAIGSLLLATADRLLLTQFVPQNDIGLYAIANKLASMLYILLSAAWTAWWPMALEMADKPDATRQYARLFEYFAAASMWLALVIGLFAPEILSVFARDIYVPAAPYALVLMIYYGPIGFLTASFYISLYVRKRTHLISVAFLLAALVNIVLNLLLDPLIGVWGAVSATVLAGMALMATAYMAGQRELRVPYRLGRVFPLGVIYLGCIATVLLFPALNTMTFKVSSLLLFVLAIMAVGVVSVEHIKIGWGAVRYRFARIFGRASPF